jgi:(S)-2-hydroxyglutarate dehydrogenase
VAQYDLVIIGAGIVGLAAAREILRRKPAVRLAIVEKEPEIGRHQTGHNSGVIHSGIYYAPGSLKARACVAGAAQMYEFCEEKGIAFERCGKVIVASDGSEVPRLEELYRRGTANGVPGLEAIGPERLRELEPHVVGVRGLWSPNTGIINYSQVAAAYADDIRAAGGEIRTSHGVEGLQTRGGERVVETTRGELTAAAVIACAGLYADRVAALSGASPSPHIVPFRGDYFLLRPERQHLVRGMIYPVPDPAFPFLGVHLTRRIDGSVWLGPNAVLAFAREGYRRTDVALRDVAEALRHRGFIRLATKYWKVGLAEMWRDVSRSAFCESLRVYVPELETNDLLPGPSGVRAQALSDDGALVDDFIVDRSGGILHVRNAPSPAATSSLAIGAMIADAYEQGD